MVKGLDVFGKYFNDFNDQYVLIGGAACDILFAKNDLSFRATRDLDVVLIVEALTTEFVNKFWGFVIEAGYRNKSASSGKPQFYRFDKPIKEEFPKMIELFSKKQFELKELDSLTPIHIDDEVSSLSAILLDEDYYKILLDGKIVVGGLSVLRPEYLIIFKAKAYVDLKTRKLNGEQIDSSNIKKHKNDILKLVVEMEVNHISEMPKKVYEDIEIFIEDLDKEPFDFNLLSNYGLNSIEVVNLLKETFL